MMGKGITEPAVFNLTTHAPLKANESNGGAIFGDSRPFNKSFQNQMTLISSEAQARDGEAIVPGAREVQYLSDQRQELPFNEATNDGIEAFAEIRELAAILPYGSDHSLLTLHGSDLDSGLESELSGLGAAVIDSSNDALPTNLWTGPSASSDLMTRLTRDSFQINFGLMLGTSSQYKDHFSGVESNITFAMKHGLDSEVKLASEGEERGQILSDLLGSRSSSQVPDSRLQSQRIEMTASNSGAPGKTTSVVLSPNELGTYLRILKAEGGGEARLQLHPAELGRMVIRVITDGDEARVSFVVENSNAKQAIESALPRLRDLMEQGGFSLADSDVSERDSSEPDDELADHHYVDANESEGRVSEIIEASQASRLLDTFA